MIVQIEYYRVSSRLLIITYNSYKKSVTIDFLNNHNEKKFINTEKSKILSYVSNLKNLKLCLLFNITLFFSTP